MFFFNLGVGEVTYRLERSLLIDVGEVSYRRGGSDV